MRRRGVILMALTVMGGAAVSAATVSSAAPANYPPPCPTQPIVWQYGGNYYVSIPDPTGQKCHDVIEVPGAVSIHKPGAADRSDGAIPVPGFTACPPHQYVYESNGHDYVWLPATDGKSCGTPYELPVTLPPM